MPVMPVAFDYIIVWRKCIVFLERVSLIFVLLVTVTANFS